MSEMSYSQSMPMLAAAAAPADRAAFIRRTYGHLAGAILAFALMEIALFQTALPEVALQALGAGRYTWLVVMLLFMGASWVADKWARSETSAGMQYAGLGLYVVAEVIIFLPLLAVASAIAGAGMIETAALLTLLLFGGLTVTVFVTQKDFSFLRPVIAIGSMVALGVIVCSIIFGFNLGVIFSAVMILMAAGSILYNTSNIIHEYRTDQHVSAALALFAAVALLFWYVLRLLIGLKRND